MLCCGLRARLWTLSLDTSLYYFSGRRRPHPCCHFRPFFRPLFRAPRRGGTRPEPSVFHERQPPGMPLWVVLLGLLGGQATAAEPPIDAATYRLDAPLTVIDITAPRATAGADNRSPIVVDLDPRASMALASDGADALKGIPGFTALRNGGTNGDPVFRGMSGSRLSILANGTTLMGACGARMDSPTSYLSPGTFDEISVVKGPQTVLWSPIGSAGTVRFERLPLRFDTPGMRFHGDLTGGTGGRNEQLADVAFGGASGDARLIAQHGHADDYRDGAGRRVPSRWDKWNLDALFGANIDARTRVELDIGAGDGQARYAGRDMDGARFRRESIALRFRQKDRDGWVETIDAQVYANYADHVMDNFSLRHPLIRFGMPMSMASNVDRLVIGGRVALRMRLTPDLHLQAGLDARTDRHRLRKAMAPGRAGADFAAKAWNDNARAANVGAFGELTWSMTPTSRWVGGGRLDLAHARDLRSRQTSPSGGEQRHALLPSGFVRYEHDLMAGALTTYAGLGHASRFPDHWERFSAAAGPVPHLNAFSGVQPEKTTQIDIGARYERGATNAWVAAYAGMVRDFILFDFGSRAAKGRPGGAAGVTSRVSNVDARVLGGEFGLTLPLAERWQAQTSLAYAWGQNLGDHRPLPQIPPLEARLALRYTRGPAAAAVDWRIAASQRRVAPEQGNVAGRDFGPSGGFGTVGVSAAYQVSQRVRVNMRVDNVFNKVYAEHLNRAGSAGFGYAANTLFNNPGRTAWISLVIDLDPPRVRS